MRKVTSYVLVLILMTVWILPVQASKLSEAKDQKETIEDKISSINKQQSIVKGKIKDAQEKKDDILETQKAEKSEYNQILDEIKGINAEIEAVDQVVKESEEKYSEQKELFKTRLKVIYENSNNEYAETLIKSKDLVDFLGRLELVSRISERDKQIMKLLDESKKDYEYKKELKEAAKLQKQDQASESQKALTTLQVSRAELDETIRKMNSNLEQWQKEEDELYKKSEEIKKLIKNLEKSGSKYAGGKMLWPAPSTGSISSYFGRRLHPIYKKYKMHTGIDINASMGKAIIAANSGTVIVSGWQSGYGNTIIVDHGGGITTLYAHCSKLLVRVGAKVGAGDTIAKVGSTGLSTGPHLHFEVRKNGSPVDPLGYVSP